MAFGVDLADVQLAQIPFEIPFELPQELRLAIIPTYDLRPQRAGSARAALKTMSQLSDFHLNESNLLDNTTFSDATAATALASASAAATAALNPIVDNSAFVDAGQLVAGLSPNNQVDVLNSLLFAQLAASAKSNRSNYAAWYDAYSSMLKNIGWLFNGGNLTTYDAGGTDFSMDEVVLNILTAALTGPEMAVITAAMTALRGLANAKDKRITLFETSSHAAKSANFQIGSASEVGGVVVLKAASFSLIAQETITDVLFFHFHHATTTLSYSRDTLTLNSGVYEKVRDTIVSRLGEASQKYITDVPLAQRP